MRVVIRSQQFPLVHKTLRTRINIRSLFFQAHALYDFEGQAGTGELTIRCGDVLTIIRKDVGEGWWEGTNANGQSGLFPEAYVEVSEL